MPLDDALHDRQSHPGAVRLVGAVQPLEHPEELVRVAQLISICRWLQLVYEDQLVLLENAPFSTRWARTRCDVAWRFHQY
jgi:hypothetical protein